MLGLMQDWPLLCHRIIDHAALNHGSRPVHSRSVEGPLHTTTYGPSAAARSKSPSASSGMASDSATALRRSPGTPGGISKPGTASWGSERSITRSTPACSPDQIAWIINHAEDRVLLTDLTFLPLIEKLADRLGTIERYVVLTDAAHLPATALRNAVAYEEWIAEVDDDFAWRSFDENTAAGMCYTSGTTGNPKGVVYSHRSNVLHALVIASRDMFGVSCRDVVMPVVPMFHANGWSLALTAPMVGASLVMPGSKLDGPSIFELLTKYHVTCTAAVPTVWLALLAHLEASGGRFEDLHRVVIGGAACPRSMVKTFQEVYGVEVVHAWGMTEMSPLGTLCSIKPEYAGLSGEERLDLQAKQGHAPFTIEMKITDEFDREEQPAQADDQERGGQTREAEGHYRRQEEADGRAVRRDLEACRTAAQFIGDPDSQPLRNHRSSALGLSQEQDEPHRNS